MKVFFGVDITNNKKNAQMDGDIFVHRTLDAAQAKAVDDELGKMTALNQKMLPKSLQILYGGFLLAAIVCFTLGLKTCGNNTISFNVRHWLFYIGGGCAVIWIALQGYIRKRAKAFAESDEGTVVINRYNAVMDNTLRSLGAPPDYAQTEVLLVAYKNKNGKIKLQKQGYALATHAGYCTYADDNALYFADIRQSYAIPRREITGIREIEKRIGFQGWYQDTPYNKGKYKPYKITRSNGDVYHLRYYYALEILHNGETYELYFPPYELETVQKLTGLAPYQK